MSFTKKVWAEGDTVTAEDLNKWEEGISQVDTSLASKADIVSPIFTGIPTATTAPTNDNSTRIATTAFVKNHNHDGSYVKLVSGNVTSTINLANGANIVPVNANMVDLGSVDKPFRDIYVGPNTLYVNGNPVLSSTGTTLDITTSLDEHLSISTSGLGTSRLASGKEVILYSGQVINIQAVGDITTTTNADYTVTSKGRISLTSDVGGQNIVLETKAVDASAHVNLKSTGQINLTSSDINFTTKPKVAGTLVLVATDFASPTFTGNATVDTLNATSNLKEGGTNLSDKYLSKTGTNLDALIDVTITAPSNTQVLQYNGSQWVNAPAPSGGGSNATSIQGKNITTPSITNTIPQYNGTDIQWVTTPADSRDATKIQGKTIATPSTASTIPQYNGTDIQWIATPSGGGGSIPFGISSGTNSYTTTIAGVTSYTDGLVVVVRFVNTNTGTSTININGLGAVNLYKFKGTAGVQLETGDIGSFHTALLVCNANIFYLVNYSDTVTGNSVHTLTNKTFTAPKVTSATSINDTNNNELIKFPATVTSAVNEVTITNAIATQSPSITASGNDTNIDLTIGGKGAGWVRTTGTLYTGGNISTVAITATSTVQGTRLISTQATGTAPLTVASTTMVTNLNAEKINGVKVFVQSAQPTAQNVGDLWFW